MNKLIYLLARGIVGLLQMLPLKMVASVGRAAGLLAWWLDVRHRRVALGNLTRFLGDKYSEAQIRELARENFCRIGENYASAVKTATMALDEALEICEVQGLEKLSVYPSDGARNLIIAIGHFGNFELYAILGHCLPGYRPASTYRGLRPSALNRLVLKLREKSGCRFFERRTESGALKAALNQKGLILGLLADQHAGRSGVWVPFLGEPCSTTAAPAILALRYSAPLHTAICYRTGLGRWRIEVGDSISLRENGAARSVEDIAHDMNHAFEQGVRRDPSNWFWVHRRWKTDKAKIK